MRQSPHNVRFILMLDKRGLPPGVIWQRCCERLVWDGPLPSVSDIIAITGTPAHRPVSDPGPAVDVARAAGGASAGAAGPGANVEGGS